MPSADPRDKRIAKLEKENAQLRAHIMELEKYIDSLEKRLAHLESKLQQNSSNSSRPPSSDSPEHAPLKKAGKPSHRPRGGQAGHEGHQRQLLPVEQVDEVYDVYPDICGHCQRALSQGCAFEPLRHQVVDIPAPTRAYVKEWRRHRVECKACGHTTCAGLPKEAPRSHFGPHLHALIGMLGVGQRSSKTQIATILYELYGITISTGCIVACEKRLSEIIRRPVLEARACVAASPVAYCDETRWAQTGRTMWLWIATTPSLATYRICAQRSREAARTLLGTFAGILVTDRFRAYDHWNPTERQVCWAHLKRDFTAIAERAHSKASKVGSHLLDAMDGMFKLWHRIRDGTLSYAAFRRQLYPIAQRMLRLLKQGQMCSCAQTAGTCSDILRNYEALWTFAWLPGVEPTNNLAERDIRHAVILRNLSFGTQSDAGPKYL